MEVGGNGNNNSWTRSTRNGLLLESRNEEPSGGLALQSKLATQLQQVWLKTQLPKDVPNSPTLSPDYRMRSFADPLQQHQLQQQFAQASLASPSHHSPEISSESNTRYSDGASTLSTVGQDSELGSDSGDPMDEDDTMLRYLSDMLMEEDLPNQKCMYVQCSSYQAMQEAMTKELSDLIEDKSPPYYDMYAFPSSVPMTNWFNEAEEDTTGSIWIDEMLSSKPVNPSSAPITTWLNEAGNNTTGNNWFDEGLSSNPMYGVPSSAPITSSLSGPGKDTTGDSWINKVLSSDPVYAVPSSAPVTTLFNEAGKDTTGNIWIDDELSSNPRDLPGQLEMKESHSRAYLVDQVSSIASGILNVTTGSSSRKNASVVVERVATGLYDRYDVPNLKNGRVLTPVDYMNGRSGVESLEELYPLLMQCGQAVARNDVRLSHELISHLRLKSSTSGDGGQRLAHYIVEALVARLSGTGAQLYTALTSARPSAVEMIKAYRELVQFIPSPKISHGWANGTIMNAVKGVDRVHIVDYGILNGVQWSSFFAKVAAREGGPPFVRITGIDFAEPGFQKNDRLQGTGRRLAATAKELGVEFEFHAIAGKWEQITAAQLALRDNETLIVNTMLRLRNLLDETVIASNPRKMVLSRIRSLNPKLFVMVVQSGGYNSPFFMSRFQATVNYFAARFDTFHSSLHPDSETRRLGEKEILGREILNIIACEGTERIERAENYRQWHTLCTNAGFKQQPLDPELGAKGLNFLKNFNSNYGISTDGHWLLNKWKETVLHAGSAWVPG